MPKPDAIEVDEATLSEWRCRAQEIDDGVEEGIPAHEAVEAVRESLREARRQADRAKSQQNERSAMTETATLPAETGTRLSEEVESVVEKLFQLPASQRLEISKRLEASVGSAEVEEAWSTEIAQRLRDIESGAVTGIPSTQVRREIEELVGEKL